MRSSSMPILMSIGKIQARFTISSRWKRMFGLSLGWVTHIHNCKNGEAEVMARAQLNNPIHPATPPCHLHAHLPSPLTSCAHLHWSTATPSLSHPMCVHTSPPHHTPSCPAYTYCTHKQHPSTHLGCAHPPAYFCTPLTTHLLPLSHGSPT